MTLLSPHWLHLLWAVPLLGAFAAAGAAARRRALARFYGAAAGRRWAATGSNARRALKAAAALGALAAVALALARPAYNPEPREVQRRGRDVLFLIDVSKSMLAQDLRPNRLERAKLAVRDVLDVAEGDRVGIVAFAGAAVLKCPLTTDYGFARLALDGLDTSAVSRGGTAIGDAIRLAMTQFFPDAETGDEGAYRDIVLLTDGEDHETFPVEAAGVAGEKGVRIIAVGLGSEASGAPVPLAAEDPAGRRQPAGFLEYDGETVRSRLDAQTLREVAEASAGGVFLNVGTGNVEMDRVYRKLVRQAEGREMEATEAVRYTEAFQWLLAAALALLLVEPFIGTRRAGR